MTIEKVFVNTADINQLQPLSKTYVPPEVNNRVWKYKSCQDWTKIMLIKTLASGY